MALCSDCTARIEYERSGTQRDFTFPFEYYEQSEINVALYNKDDREWQATDAWSLVNPTTIRMDQPPVGRLVIYRCTDLDQMRATFQPGTSIKALDLNNDFDQLRNAIEEAKCATDNSNDRLDYARDLFLNRIDADSTDPKTGTPGDLVKANSRLTIDDDHVASTQWIDNRYWDQCEETTYASDNWFDEIDDVHVPTTKAVEQRLDDLSALRGVKKVTGNMQRQQQWDEDVTNDEYIATTDAIVERLDNYLADVNTEYPSSYWLQPGKLWVKGDTAEMFFRRDSGSQWIQLDTKGDQGEPGQDSTVPGPDGPAGTIEIGNTTTGAPGTDAEVINVGTDTAAVLEFTIPKGEKGDPGSGGGEILTFTAPLVKTGTVVSIDLLTIPNA